MIVLALMTIKCKIKAAVTMLYRFWSFQGSDGNDDKPADGVPVFADTTGSPQFAAATWGI